MSDHIDTCVIGAGVVGLAVAKTLAPHCSELLVLEQLDQVGQGVSSRNSEVIHAGIYYPQNSLKSTLCIDGKELLYDYCTQRGIGHHRLGKLIVATTADEEQSLDNIKQQAQLCGVDDLTYWSLAMLQKNETNVKATAALFSPSTGVINSHELMQAFCADIATDNGSVVTRTQVVAIKKQTNHFVLHCIIDNQPYEFTCRVLINAAGLNATSLAGKTDFICADSIPDLFLCKGSYFSYGSKQPFKHLIYPVPPRTNAGLGIHATLDLAGQVKFGPDVEYTQDLHYKVDETRKENFVSAIQRYFPDLDPRQLKPDYAGIRPKLQGPNGSVKDFVIQGHLQHGVANYVQLFGIESPGLTACLAIARQVQKQLY